MVDRVTVGDGSSPPFYEVDDPVGQGELSDLVTPFTMGSFTTKSMALVDDAGECREAAWWR